MESTLNISLYSVSTYAKAKNISRPTVYEWIKKNKLEVVKIADKKFVKELG